MNLSDLGKILLIAGLMMAVIGTVFVLLGKLQLLGRLPGDIDIQKKGYTLYFPLTTCVLLSILLTLLFRFFLKR